MLVKNKNKISKSVKKKFLKNIARYTDGASRKRNYPNIQRRLLLVIVVLARDGIVFVSILTLPIYMLGLLLGLSRLYFAKKQTSFLSLKMSCIELFYPKGVQR